MISMTSKNSTNNVKWDVFISHASEDKDIFVRELALELRRQNIKVWYDEFTLGVGDSLKRSIEKGLADSLLGIVVLSKNFFSKQWPQKELDALLAKEIKGKKIILPIWLNLDSNDIFDFSPILADKYALNATLGIKSIVEKIIEQIKIIQHDDNYEKIVSVILRYKHANNYEQTVIYNEINLRLNQIISCNRELVSICDEIDRSLKKSEFEFYSDEWETIANEKYFEEEKKAYLKYNIPREIWGIPYFEKIDKDWQKESERLIRKWVSGKLSQEDFERLFYLMDDEFDLDIHYIFYGFAHGEITNQSSELLGNHFYEIGSRNLILIPP